MVSSRPAFTKDFLQKCGTSSFQAGFSAYPHKCHTSPQENPAHRRPFSLCISTIYNILFLLLCYHKKFSALCIVKNRLLPSPKQNSACAIFHPAFLAPSLQAKNAGRASKTRPAFSFSTLKIYSKKYTHGSPAGRQGTAWNRSPHTMPSTEPAVTSSIWARYASALSSGSSTVSAMSEP